MNYSMALKEYGDNRMALLLYWDVAAFFSSAFLYLAAVTYTGAEADNHLGMRNPELWYGWQSELTYTVIKVSAALSSGSCGAFPPRAPFPPTVRLPAIFVLLRCSSSCPPSPSCRSPSA